MRDAEQTEENPFSYANFVKSRNLPPVDLFADVSATPPPPPRAASSSIPSSQASRPSPVDLFAAPPPPAPVALATPVPTPLDVKAKAKKEDEENPFAFHNWVKSQQTGGASSSGGGTTAASSGGAGSTLSSSGGSSLASSSSAASNEDLMRRLREAEARAAEAHKAMKAMKEKEAKEAAALEAVVQAVERNLGTATQRAEKAERKLAEVQAELDRRKQQGGTADERARIDLLEKQLSAAQSRNAQLAAHINLLAEGATKEAQAIEAGSAALKQLALQLLSADKISPLP